MTAIKKASGVWALLLNRVGDFWGWMSDRAVHCLGILHFGRAWNLARLAWQEEEFAYSPRGHGHVEAFRLATNAYAPQAAILFDKFHVIRHLGEALMQFARASMPGSKVASGATSRARNTRCRRARRTAPSTARRR
jgi:hypothetical protein